MDIPRVTKDCALLSCTIQLRQVQKNGKGNAVFI